MPPARRFVIAAWAVALLVALPVRATAQHSAFVDAFIDFHSALPGTYGDEGPQVMAALDRMAVALDAWERATRDQERALRARSGTTSADLALLYADEYRLDDAITAMQLAIDGEPRRASYHVFLGLAQHARGRRVEAGAAFAAAHAIDPADPIAAYLVAAHLADEGGSDQLTPLVTTLLAASARGDPPRVAPFPRFALIDDLWAKTPIFSPPGYADGFAAMAAGHFREAIERFRADTAKDPLVADAAGRAPRMLSGIAALRARQGNEAIVHLEASAATLSDSSEVHRVLGVAYRAMGKLPEGIAQFEEAVRLAPRDARPRITLGSALMEAGHLDDATRVLLDTITVLPTSGEARWLLAQVYERLDRGMDAVATLEEAATLTVMAGKSHLYWRIAELAHLYRRDNSRVIDAISRRTWLALNDPGTHKDLGLAYHRAGRDDEALAEFTLAMLLGHEDTEMLAAIGQIHLASGRLGDAEAASRRAVALDPEFPLARYVLGTTLRRQGMIDLATEQLDVFKRLQVALFTAQVRTFEREKSIHAARRLAASGRFEEAAVAFEKAANLDASEDVYRELAAIYAKLGREKDRARALASADAIRSQ